MIGDTATAGYTHPIVNAVADLEATLDGCADARLWSLSVKELDDLLPRAHALLARITGTLVLPLIREADSRGACQEYDAASTAEWVRYLLRIPHRQAKQLVALARAVDGDLTATAAALAAGRCTGSAGGSWRSSTPTTATNCSAGNSTAPTGKPKKPGNCTASPAAAGSGWPAGWTTRAGRSSAPPWTPWPPPAPPTPANRTPAPTPGGWPTPWSNSPTGRYAAGTYPP